MPKIDRPLLGEIFVRLICSPKTSKESPVVIGTSSPHKMLLNSYNAGVIWSSLFEEHHPINGVQRICINLCKEHISIDPIYFIYKK